MSNGNLTVAQNTAIAAPKTLKGWLQSDQFRAEIAKALPKHCDADRMLRIAVTAMTRTPKLAECDQASFLRCMLDLAQWGLEPNGRDAHLIPFRDNKRNITQCTLILDFKGLVQLVYRTGKVKSVHSDVVHEGDSFTYDLGEVRGHVPWFLRRDADKPAEQGKVYAAYVRVVLSDGAVKCEVMSREDIEKIRKRSRAGRSGPWVTDWAEMAKKTVFRRATKWLPISAEMVDALDKDDDVQPVVSAVAQPSSLDMLATQLTERIEAQPEPSLEPEPDTVPEPSRGFGVPRPSCEAQPETQPDTQPETETEHIPGQPARLAAVAELTDAAELNKLLESFRDDERLTDEQFAELEQAIVEKKGVTV